MVVVVNPNEAHTNPSLPCPALPSVFPSARIPRPVSPGEKGMAAFVKRYKRHELASPSFPTQPSQSERPLTSGPRGRRR